MGKPPGYLKRLREIGRADPTFDHIIQLEKELFVSESDRATGVLFGTLLENNLRTLILSKMRGDLSLDETDRLMSFEGPVGSFSAKIRIAHAFDIIGPLVRDDLNLIREIRNAFAHSRIPITFISPEVADACTHLKIPDDPSSSIPQGLLAQLSEGGRSTSKDDPRLRFITACHAISYRMILTRDHNYQREGSRILAKGEDLLP